MQNITNNTSFIGKNLIVLKKIDSTNDYAKLLLANSGPVQDGTVILAEEQYGGRGQAGSSWQSDPRKNLTFSIVLGCSFLPPCRQFYLSMAMSLGVLDCVQSLIEKAGIARNACGKQACVKWPNDIYVGRKKLGGILIENILSGSVMKTSVVGIGLNVNQENFPGLPGATSLKLETKGDFPLEALLDSLCQAIEARFLQLKSGAREDLKEAYLRHLLGFGRKQLFRAGPAGAGRRPSAFTSDAAGTALPTVPFEGFISGITPEGKLLVSTAEGVQSFDRKEIVFL